jgi:hypothetical protein
MQYLETRIEHEPDLQLWELRQALTEVFDLIVGESTISESLQRRGYSRKVVCQELSCAFLFEYNYLNRSLTMLASVAKKSEQHIN